MNEDGLCVKRDGSVLTGLYKPSSGEIKIGDCDVGSCNQSLLRKSIGYIQQEPILLETSIKKNITLNRKDVSEKDIIEACIKANIYDYIQTLENGLETKLYNNGSNLSGGQRQRIILARIFLYKPSLIILDEATAALDEENERMILDSLKVIGKDSTVIIISHKLSTLENVDKVLYLQNGVLSEN